MENLTFFDCNVCIGRSDIPVKGASSQYGTVEYLLHEMEYFGIDEALVFHRTAKIGCARLGNDILMKEISDYSNLHPCWVVSPYAVREADRPENIVKEIKSNKIKAVRLFPDSSPVDVGRYKYPLTKWMCGNLLAALQEQGIPVFCSLGSEKLHELCGEFPELPVVNGGPCTHSFCRLLAIHENLYLETGLLAEHGMTEYICRNFGAERLIFGTTFGGQRPISPGAALTEITMAAICREEKEKIASGNLKKLLKLGASAKRTVKEYSDPFIMSLRQGKPIKTELIIDAHAHSDTEKGVLPSAGPDGMVEVMDRLGVDKACISGSGSMGGDCPIINNINAEVVKAFPERFIGYTRVDPNYPEEIERELNLRFKQAGIKHIKLHPVFHNYPVTGEGYKPAFEFALKHQSVVLSHSQAETETCSPKMFDEIAAKYPDVSIIIGHAGNAGDSHKEAIEVMQKRKNVYIDTSGWCMTCLGVLEYVVKRIGSDRILFGTDFVFISEPFQMGPIAYARISYEDKRKIMGLNAAKLFGIDLKG